MKTQRCARPRIPVLVAVSVLLAACGTGSSDAAGRERTTAEVDSQSSGSVVDGDGSPVRTVSEVYQTVDYDAAPAASALRDDRESDEFPPPLIEPDRIVSGGVPPDGIPAIDSPQFAPIDQTDFLQPNEGLIVVQVEDEAKAYPIQILIWHEIVNDEIGGLPVTVTYCPLCNSALAFDRRVGSRLLDFGTSGELYQSALVMYDRQTESLWAHFTGQGLVGHYAGATLTPVPAQMLSFEKVEARFPGALVLTRDTGHARPYGTNPYIGYDEETTDPFGPFFDGEIDPRLPPKARVVGVTIDDDAYAINITEPESTTVVEVSVAGQDLVVFHRPGLASALDRASVATGRDVGQTGTFLAADGDGNPLTFAVDQDRFIDNETGSEWTLAGEAAAGKMAGQSLEPVPQLNTFWFAWSTYHPETGLVDG